MYLQNLLDQKSQLLEACITFHQEGLIPANTWVIDLDTIVNNARALAAEAKRLGLTTYLMSKQHNRNPYINHLALANGLDKIVAVDATGALMCNRYNLPLGHVGHLNQIPRHLVPAMVAMKPDVFTIYNIEHARWINEAAKELNIVQDLLIRVYADGDVFFDGQEGGFAEQEIPHIVSELTALSNVSLVGVTAFPCLRYNETTEQRVEVTPNIHTVTRAVEQLRELGVEIKQINTPGNTSCSVMSLLKEYGATHVEPGNALLGTTPNHAFHCDEAEQTAFAYVTEVSHHYDGRAYAYGGGVYHTSYSDRIDGLVGSAWEDAKENGVEYIHDVVQDIDYHMQLKPKQGQRCEVGDTVLFGYRTQMHMTRSYILPISGLSGQRELKLHYLFDNANTALDKSFNPVDPTKVLEDIERLIKEW